MQIGYTFPAKLLSKYGIDRLRIYVQGTNLFTITKYDGLDPELPSQPDSNGQNREYDSNMVLTRAIIRIHQLILFGINLTFLILI